MNTNDFLHMEQGLENDEPNRCPGCGVEIPDDAKACGQCPTLDEYGPLD